MTPEILAQQHARAFAGQSRGWSGQEFTDLLSSPHVFLTHLGAGFALTRVVADEAELLTLATDPDHRRQGVARDVLTHLESEARTRGAHLIFLEVSEANTAAKKLYLSCGYSETSRRARYYKDTRGVRHDALIFQKRL